MPEKFWSVGLIIKKNYILKEGNNTASLAQSLSLDWDWLNLSCTQYGSGQTHEKHRGIHYLFLLYLAQWDPHRLKINYLDTEMGNLESVKGLLYWACSLYSPKKW